MKADSISLASPPRGEGGSPDSDRDRRYPPGDPRRAYLDALDRVHAARKRAKEAEVDHAAGRGSHEDAEKFRAEADEAEAALLKVLSDAAALGQFLLRAALSHPAQQATNNIFLASALEGVTKPVWDDLLGRIIDLEALAAGVGG